jgi:hypothetical protein
VIDKGKSPASNAGLDSLIIALSEHSMRYAIKIRHAVTTGLIDSPVPHHHR